MTEPVAEVLDLPTAEQRARRPRPRFGDQALIVCDNLVKIYKVADLEVVALQGLDLLVESGEFIALIGASGSGKSTLLNILGGLDVPSAGRAVVAGHQLADMGSAEQTRYLRHVIGFIWQQTSRNLLPYLTTLENVALPMVLDGIPARTRDTFARELLDQVGLADRADHRPDRMSGGEQQRAAIAVALANRPEVLLADEPTGELDTATAHQIFDLFRSLNRDLGVTIVVATHDLLVSDQVNRTVAIRDGRVSSEVLRQRTISDAGEHHVIATEYAVLDRAGRLQLPRAHVEALGLEKRVRLELEADHIGVWPDQPADRAGASAAGMTAGMDPRTDGHAGKAGPPGTTGTPGKPGTAGPPATPGTTSRPADATRDGAVVAPDGPPDGPPDHDRYRPPRRTDDPGEGGRDP